jgi:hypothetical protein
MALGNIDTHRMGIASKIEKEEYSMFQNKINQIYDNPNVPDGAIKAAYCYYTLLNGLNVHALSSFRRTLQSDAPRVCQLLQILQGAQGGWFSQLEKRIQSGVPGHLIELCQIPNIGKVRAKRLYDAGISTAADLVSFDKDQLKRILNLKPGKLQDVITEAEKISLLS